MQRYLFLILFFFSLCSNNTAQAFENSPWSFGILAGYGYGIGTCDNCEIPNGVNHSYQYGYGMLTGAYRFSESHSTRLSIGLDKYNKDSPFTNSKKIFVAAEGYYIYHFYNERRIFAPYVLAGFRIPYFNIGLGIGNEFTLANTLSVFVEVLANTLFTIDNRFEGRAGVLIHF